MERVTQWCVFGMGPLLALQRRSFADMDCNVRELWERERLVRVAVLGGGGQGRQQGTGEEERASRRKFISVHAGAGARRPSWLDSLDMGVRARMRHTLSSCSVC